MEHTATYSPNDNKLRLYPAYRLSPEDYARIKAHGFAWAPKQEIFVAPMWTPAREDLLLEWCGEIGDEDKTPAERAEERAERFDEYSEKRAADAESARRAVSAIADNIPLGQPILIGHHSERHARKDAERIENGMRRAVNAWRTSEYWKQRAAASLAHADYKERPDVRARRIKGIEADLRKLDRSDKESAANLALWALVDQPEKWKQGEDSPQTREERAAYIAGRVHSVVNRKSEHGGNWTAYDVLRLPAEERYKAAPVMTVDEVLHDVRANHARATEYRNRWREHYANRLAYERAMLGQTDYIQPAKKPSRAALPLLNYRGDRSGLNPYGTEKTINYPAHEMTQAEFAAVNRDYKGTRIAADGSHRFRTAYIAPRGAINGRTLVAVFLTDAKAHPKPGGEIKTDEEAEVQARIEKGRAKLDAEIAHARAVREHNRAVVRAHGNGNAPTAKAAQPAQGEIFAQMADTLRQGVQVVSAPQLFPTPPDLAARVVELADIQPGQRILEPSAGTGAILGAINGRAKECAVVAVEINPALGGRLDATRCAVVVGDFLKCEASTLWGAFDRILMNPPFANADDVRHIQHARSMLKPGGRLVAICANGPRQREALMPLADLWEDLPAGTFKESGTGVNTALLVIEG